MKRICRMIITLCLPLLLCSPVMAQHSGPYIGISAGGNAMLDAKSDDSQGEFKFTFKPALQGSAVLGWDFAPGNPVGEGRIELEYTHRSNQLDEVTFAEGTFKGAGDVKADSLLINFFGVYPDKKNWVPYFGIGLGVARIEASDLKVTGQPLATGSDTVFAYQLGTGVDFPVTKNLNFDLGYRFFGSLRPELTEATGQKFKMDYFCHSVVLGLRVGF